MDDKNKILKDEKKLSVSLKRALLKIKKINSKISDYESRDEAENTLSKLKNI